MKLNAKQWCKIQETLANLKCPNCFSANCKCTENEGTNAECEDCKCKFEFSPDIALLVNE